MPLNMNMLFVQHSVYRTHDIYLTTHRLIGIWVVSPFWYYKQCCNERPWRYPLCKLSSLFNLIQKDTETSRIVSPNIWHYSPAELAQLS